MTTKDEATMLGVRNAWDFWLSDRPISTWQCMVDGVEAAFKAWLNEHTLELIEAIADRAADEAR